MNLSDFSNEVLLDKTQSLAQKERALTLEVLSHLREIERRSLYAEIGYSSLFEYAVKELKYSEGAAQRRISSMRLIRDLPEVESKIESGKLSLSSLSQAQVFFRQEKIEAEAKLEILTSLEGKSTRDVEKELVSRSSEPAKLIPEKLRAVSETHTELRLLLDDALLKDLEELKCLLATRLATSNMKETLAYAVRRTLKELRPKEPKALKETKEPKALKEPQNLSSGSPPPAPAVKKSRYVPRDIQRHVWKRDGAQCTYWHNGKRCGSRYGLEMDHIKPFSRGGTSSLENLRLRCRAHNQLTAIKDLGAGKMAISERDNTKRPPKARSPEGSFDENIQFF
jgi:hypothetical protein